MKIKSSDGNKEVEVTKSEIKELIQKEGGNREKYLTPNVFLTSEDGKSIGLYYQSNNGSFEYICSVSWDGKKIFISS